MSYTITPSSDATSVVTGEPLESFCTSFILDTQDGLSAAVETGACAQIAIEGGDTVHVSGGSACAQSITLAKADVQADWIACTVSGSAQDLTVRQTDAGVSLQSDQSCTLDAALLDAFNQTEFGSVSVSSGQTARIEQGEQPGEIVVTENGVQRTVSMGRSVVFHTSGGTEIPALTDLPAGSVIAQPDDPTLLGYVFDGWYTSTEYLPENRWDFATDTVNENISLYAKWISLKDETCVEEFYLNKTDTEPAEVLMLAYQSPIAVPDGFDRIDYTMELVDCDTDRPIDLETAVMGQNGIRVYAKYTPLTYYASFIVDGAQVGEKVPFTVETEKLQTPSDPIKEGYTFIGWSPEIPATMPAEDLEFTAVFEQDKYIATLIADGEVVKTIEYTHGQKSIQLPEVLEKEGFTGAWPSYSLLDGGMTITAVYTKNQYTVTWNIDGEATSSTVYFDDTIEKPADPQKEGFTFKGWTPEVPATMPAKDMTFTAVFEKIQPPKIAIHNYTSSRTVDYRTTITFSADEITNPVKDAKIHWFIDGQDKGASDACTVKEAKKDFTVQAKYMKDGKVLAESEIGTVKVSAGFFARLKAFIRALFGRLPKVVQEYLGFEIIDRVLP